MKKLLLILAGICLGSTGFTILRQDGARSNTTAASLVQVLQSATNDLSSAQENLSTLKDEVQAKQERLLQARQYPNISPELLKILEGQYGVAGSKGWAELRQQLGIGWNSSPDYVLVNKQAIKDVWYNKLYLDGRLSSDSVNLLGLSPEEKTSVKAALAQAREGQWLNVTSTSPGGDIVAQLTITPPDSAFEAGQSNAFVTAINTAIGPERANLFVHDAWRELLSDLAPSENETMTIRQTDVDGQPDLVCEIMQGSNVSTTPVRYAMYPAFPVLKLFPGGWQAMAQAMNFNLPQRFFPPNYRQ